MTLNAIATVSSSNGTLLMTLSCWATRASLVRVETAMPTQMDHAASNGVKIDLGHDVAGVDDRRGDCGLGEQLDHQDVQGEDEIGDGHSGNEDGVSPCPAGTLRG